MLMWEVMSGEFQTESVFTVVWLEDYLFQKHAVASGHPPGLSGSEFLMEHLRM